MPPQLQAHTPRSCLRPQAEKSAARPESEEPLHDRIRAPSGPPRRSLCAATALGDRLNKEHPDGVALPLGLEWWKEGNSWRLHFTYIVDALDTWASAQVYKGSTEPRRALMAMLAVDSAAGLPPCDKSAQWFGKDHPTPYRPAMLLAAGAATPPTSAAPPASKNSICMRANRLCRRHCCSSSNTSAACWKPSTHSAHKNTLNP